MCPSLQPGRPVTNKCRDESPISARTELVNSSLPRADSETPSSGPELFEQEAPRMQFQPLSSRPLLFTLSSSSPFAGKATSWENPKAVP